MERLTPIRGTVLKTVTLSRYAALARASTVAPGPLSPETNLSGGLLLFVLCGVEAHPGADRLLRGQRR